jgi:RNA polymerase sigma-70 factor (sigma-E family)
LERAAVGFEEFLDEELAALRRYATVLTGDPQRAHDVLAEALLRAHSRWSRIGRMDLPAAYVRRMVTNEFLSEKRRWSARHIRLTRSGDVPDVALPDLAGNVDERAHLRQLLTGLAPRQRAVLVLRYYLGFDDGEIAAELSITPGAVRTAASRAIAALRIATTNAQTSSPAAAVRTGGRPGRAPATSHRQEEDS